MKDKDIVLVRYSFILQPDGQLRSQVDNIPPDEFLKVANEVDKSWEDAPAISKAINYLIRRFEDLDTDVDKYLSSI